MEMRALRTAMPPSGTGPVRKGTGWIPPREKKTPLLGKQKLSLHNKSQIFPSPLHLLLGYNSSRQCNEAARRHTGHCRGKLAHQGCCQVTPTQRLSPVAEDTDVFKAHQCPSPAGRALSPTERACTALAKCFLYQQTLHTSHLFYFPIPSPKVYIKQQQRWKMCSLH